MALRIYQRLHTLLVSLALTCTISASAQTIIDPMMNPVPINPSPLFQPSQAFADENLSLFESTEETEFIVDAETPQPVFEGTPIESLPTESIQPSCTTDEPGPTAEPSCTSEAADAASCTMETSATAGSHHWLRALGCCSCEDIDAPCAKSHGKLHYWNNFDYIDDPEYDGHCLGDSLKRLGKNWDGCLGCTGGSGGSDSWIDVGGRFRLRYHNEQGLGRRENSVLLDDVETNHLVTQARIFGDWHINKRLRVFAEGIYADVTGATDGYRPRGNERNRGDALNLFVDLKAADNTTVRVGRQQLLYGSRRLIAGPGWANTSRSHDGIKVIQEFGNLRIDGLFMKRVPVLVDDFDETDYDRTLFGAWATYKGSRDTMDAYYLGLDDDRPASEKTLHTIGARLSGGENWLYDIEGAGQFGRQDALGLDHAAAFATAGVGRKLSSLPWSPTLWAYFDFATGDTETGSFNRFDWIFNRAHHYLGFIDLAHRSNVEIPSLEMTLNPTKRLRILTRYFHTIANQENDTVAALGGLTAAQNTTSQDYGDTVDVAAYYKISPRSNARVGYSHFWPGNKILSDNDASFTYAEWAIWF